MCTLVFGLFTDALPTARLYSVR